MFKFTILSLLSLLGLHATLCIAQETIPVAWSITTYEDLTVNVGDTVEFSWSGTHNVHIHPTESCDSTGAILVGDETGASYVFTEEDAGTDIFFACDVGEHCEFGQIIKFTVAGASPVEATPSPVPAPTAPTAASIPIAWSITTYEDQTANVGDIVEFSWSGTHNVHIHPTESCDSTGAILVGDETGASYIFTEEDAGTDVFFACDVGEHCEFGQIIKFTVAGSSPVPAPSAPTAAAPVATPTDAPVSSPSYYGSGAAQYSVLSVAPLLFTMFVLNQYEW